MRFPREITGDELAKALKMLGYECTRQTGSHMRRTIQQHGQHHVTVPRQDPLRLGTLSAILTDVAIHFNSSREEITERIFS